MGYSLAGHREYFIRFFFKTRFCQTLTYLLKKCGDGEAARMENTTQKNTYDILKSRIDTLD